LWKPGAGILLAGHGAGGHPGLAAREATGCTGRGSPGVRASLTISAVFFGQLFAANSIPT